jgi:hypothetical protein
MGKPADTRLTPDVAREICERTGSAAVLEGSISKLGQQYVIGLRARNCANGAILDEEQTQAGTKEEVLKSLDPIAARFRNKVGESLASIEKLNVPLIEATTPSIEAFRAYSQAQKRLASQGDAASIPFLKRAIALDDKFALAYADLGFAYDDNGESALSLQNATKAYQLKDRVSQREQFAITATYHMHVTGNIEEAQKTCQSWVEIIRVIRTRTDTFPGAFTACLAGTTKPWKRARKQWRQVRISLSPITFWPWVISR